MNNIRHRSYQGLEYSGLPIHSARGVHEFVCDLVSKNVPRGARVLDVGSGSGALSLRLKMMGYDVTALDLSPEHLDLEGIQVVKGDICSPVDCGIRDRKFACVVAVELIEHLPNLEAGFRNIAACLSEGGFLVVTTPNVNHFVARLRFLMSGAPSYFDEKAFYETGHRNILPQWLVPLLLAEQGLRVADVFQCGMSDKSERGAALSKLVGFLGRMRRPDHWFDDGRISVFTAHKEKCAGANT